MPVKVQLDRYHYTLDGALHCDWTTLDGVRRTFVYRTGIGWREVKP